MRRGLHGTTLDCHPGRGRPRHPVPLEWIAVVLVILVMRAGTALAIFASARLSLQAALRTFLLPLGAQVLVATYPDWSMASMGLETGLTFLWLGGLPLAARALVEQPAIRAAGASRAGAGWLLRLRS